MTSIFFVLLSAVCAAGHAAGIMAQDIDRPLKHPVLRREEPQGMVENDQKVSTPVRFSWYKFSVDKTRDGLGTTSYSRFALQDTLGKQLDLDKTEVAAVFFAGKSQRPADEVVGMTANSSTKVGYGDSLIIHLLQEHSVGSYYWVTSYDDSELDPVSWTFSGSDDGDEWLTLSQKELYPVPSVRGAIIGSFITSKNIVVEETLKGVMPCFGNFSYTVWKQELSTTTAAPVPSPRPEEIAPEEIVHVQPPATSTKAPCIKPISAAPKAPCIKPISTTPKSLASESKAPCKKRTVRTTTTTTFMQNQTNQSTTTSTPESTNLITTLPYAAGIDALGIIDSVVSRAAQAETRTDNVFDLPVVPMYPFSLARDSYLVATGKEATAFTFEVGLSVDRLADFIRLQTGKPDVHPSSLSLKVSDFEFSWADHNCAPEQQNFIDLAPIRADASKFSLQRCGGLLTGSIDLSSQQYPLGDSRFYGLFWLSGEFKKNRSALAGPGPHDDLARVRIEELVISEKRDGVVLEHSICGGRDRANYLGCPKTNPLEIVHPPNNLGQSSRFCTGRYEIKENEECISTE